MEAPSTEASSFRLGFFAVLRREVHTIAHSPFYHLFTFILPLISFGILGALFYQESLTDMPIIVRDGDHSKLSRQLVRMADASATLKVVAHVQDLSEGTRYIREGKAYAMMYIPGDLEHDLKRGDAPPVTLYYNNQWLLTSGVIFRAAREVIGTLSAGLDIRSRMMKGDSPPQAWEQYEPIRVDQHLLFNPNLNYRYFLLPALLPTMIQIFIAMVTVRAVGTELKHGTAGEWLRVAGGRPWVAVTAKLLPYTLCFLVLTNFMVALLVRFAGVPLYGSLGVLLIGSFLFVLAYQSTAFALVAVFANLRLANSMAGFYTGPAFAFAGITYPALGMPPPAKLMSVALPLTHYLHVVLQQALKGAPPEVSAKPLFVLALFVILPPLLLMPRMGRLMRDPAYWGRI
ncbi:MAG TPA: ABC transporter permease [Candidatus Hydrogenedentes bacterium]|nr:ABC transporter permease [Candidatus Hydrogenedentota bacterium]HPG67630.1 ABC transporter permease [Candidatus Hydrogenedentota bacterium]